jgi:hypothetical protein
MYRLSDFTDEERDSCLPIVEQALELTALARDEGVLALEGWAKAHDNTFVSFLLMIIIDGTDPRIVEDFGRTIIDAGGYKGGELLSRLLTLESVLMVQAGMNPRLVEVKLLAMLGEKYLMAKGLYSTSGTPYFPEYDRRFAALSAQEGLPASKAFNEAFETMNDRDIQAVLRETDRVDFSVSLSGSTGAAAVRLMNNLSKRLGAMVLEGIDATNTTEEEIYAAQGRILATVDKLLKSGEIAKNATGQ